MNANRTNYTKDEELPRRRGKIVWFKPNTLEQKGDYGFIQPDEEGPQIFFHIKAIDQAAPFVPDIDVEVEYGIGSTRKGPCAISIRKV